ncbi:hypothetical protein FGIG_05659 [Fasciola gigantica]|uniref:Uncharacterized protein n=1 Tax=Fasciola gigantica TaxID=46835 RepID=A0A504YVQ1_FASGI|nr:hypothetical protein FGIG_05659 [Fasciola gigantica]
MALNSNDIEAPSHPDLLASKLDWSRPPEISCYTDHSFDVWDTSDLNNIRGRLSLFYQSRGVWTISCLVETRPNLSPSMSSCRFGDCYTSRNSALPSLWTSGAFVTCADDGTIRFWSPGEESTNDGASVSATNLQN